MSDSDTWTNRANVYDNLEWVQDDKFLTAFLDAAQLEREDSVLDVGTGTGLLVKAIAPFVTDVVGIDNSAAMLEEGSIGQLMDARELTFQDACFDKVLARMVLHHITEGIDRALTECYRVLKPGGLIVVGEALPPVEENRVDREFVRGWYERVLKLKEERLTFSEYDIVDLLAAAGFREIRIDYYTIYQLSVRNWLENGGLSEETRAAIWKAYQTAPEAVERAYRLKHIEAVELEPEEDVEDDEGEEVEEPEVEEREEDYLIDCRHAIITARRPGKTVKPRPRREQLDRCLPELLKTGGKALYIGASMFRADYLTELHEAGYKVTVLDIWFPNVWHLAADSRVERVIHGDVRNVGKMGLPPFDVAFWWHGPEHLRQKEVRKALAELEKMAGLVVLGCPDGHYLLGSAYGNPHEQHLSAWVPGDFEKMGYKAESLGGESGTETCHILAWKGRG